jgi:hypothetical protein
MCQKLHALHSTLILVSQFNWNMILSISNEMDKVLCQKKKKKKKESIMLVFFRGVELSF